MGLSDFVSYLGDKYSKEAVSHLENKKNPKIGIVARPRYVDEVGFAFDNTHNSIRMLIQENGGTPRIFLSQQKFTDYNPEHNKPIPPLTSEEKEKIVVELMSCDGIMLTGLQPEGEYEKFVCDSCARLGIPIMGMDGFSQMSRTSNGEVVKASTIIDKFIDKASERTTAREKGVLLEDDSAKRRHPRIAIISKQLYLDEETVFNRVADGVRYAMCDSGAIVRGIIPQTNKRIFNRTDELDTTELSDKEKTAIEDELKDCEGIVLPGGLASNAYEMYVVQYAYSHNIPILGICAGMNNIVRALGGTTVQRKDLESKHNVPHKQFAHGLDIVDKGSKYAKIIGMDSTQVNSIHSYFIDKVPECLKVVARDDDGNIEVVEASDAQKSFVIGVKYHPELMVDFSPEQHKVFDELNKVCQNRLMAKQHAAELA